jgi:hypothetical protein
MNSQGGLLSMFERAAASQVGWLYVLAFVSVVAVLWLRRREPRTDTMRAGFIMWSIWLVIYGLAYSEGEIHTYYVVTLGPALAAICGAGVVELWRAYRAGGRRAWLLPLAVAGSDVWAIYLAYGYSDVPWLADPGPRGTRGRGDRRTSYSAAATGRGAASAGARSCGEHPGRERGAGRVGGVGDHLEFDRLNDGRRRPQRGGRARIR